MKLFLVLSLCIMGVLNKAVDEDVQSVKAARRAMPALEHEEVRDEFGQYSLRYVTAEGTIVSERGRLVPTTNGTDYVLIIEGEVSYINDDGETYITKYTAGLDGYNASVTHLPKAPEPEPELGLEPETATIA